MMTKLQSLTPSETNTNWLERAQIKLKEEGIAAWLIYDFQGQNPVAQRFLQLENMQSRVFCLVPQEGRASLLVHTTDQSLLPTMHMNIRTYSSQESLIKNLTALLPKDPVALEYSQSLPSLSYVDAGTMDSLRSLGLQIVSSATLLADYDRVTKEQLAAHKRAAQHLTVAKDIAFDYISLHAPMHKGLKESDVQTAIHNYLQAHNLKTAKPATVAFGKHSSEANYQNDMRHDGILSRGDVIMISLNAKASRSDAPYASMTWMGVYGEPSVQFFKLWDVLKEARLKALRAIQQAYREARQASGAEIDRCARQFLNEKGYANAFSRRTGYSLGSQELQGNAVFLDDFETPDSRLLQSGLIITVEPALYLEQFGIKTGVNLYLGNKEPQLTSKLQQELELI